MKGALFSGNVRVAYVDADGVPTGNYIGIVNAVKLALNVPDPDTKTRQSKMNESYGQALDQIFQPKPTEVELTTDDVGDQEVMAWAVNGLPTGFNQAADDIVSAVYTANKGQWIRLPHRRISTVVVKNNAGDVTYTANTDYLVDATAGFIKITEAGAIDDASTIKISYHAAEVTGKTVRVGARSALSLAIEGDMRNLVDNSEVHVRIPLARLSPTGGLDLMGTDFLVAALKGTAIAVGGGDVAEITAIDAE